MPRSGVTIYDLLISCPGDVLEEIEVIREVVETFNRNFGDINNIRIEVKHWSTDAYPQSGGSAQELLNKQFIHECDAAVAVFWTRFGTPTDKHQSGTEEEIEDMIRNGKQVFLYFSDKAIIPSAIDSEQYKKVNSFRSKYENKGLYWNYNDINQFKQLFLNHLSLYFLKLLTKEKEDPDQLLPNLTIRGVYDNAPSENLFIQHGNWTQSRFMIDRKKDIYEIFQKVMEFSLPKQQCEDLSTEGLMKNDENVILSEITKSIVTLNSLAKWEPVNFSDNIHNVISNYANNNNITLSDDFFYVGDLQKTKSGITLSTFGNNGLSLNGTDDEKEKYKLIKNLYRKIDKYDEWNKLLLALQNKGAVKCIISNVGKTFDEDIDIRLKIEKGCICKRAELPIPGYSIINTFNENNFEELFYKMQRSILADEYSNYPIKKNIPIFNNPIPLLNQKTYEEKYRESKDEYEENVSEIFCYEFFENEDYDILVFKVPYLKQNTNMNFPSILYFNKYPKSIEYEITSKHFPKVVSEKIEVKIEQV